MQCCFRFFFGKLLASMHNLPVTVFTLDKSEWFHHSHMMSATKAGRTGSTNLLTTQLILPVSGKIVLTVKKCIQNLY